MQSGAWAAFAAAAPNEMVPGEPDDPPEPQNLDEVIEVWHVTPVVSSDSEMVLCEDWMDAIDAAADAVEHLVMQYDADALPVEEVKIWMRRMTRRQLLHKIDSGGDD